MLLALAALAAALAAPSTRPMVAAEAKSGAVERGALELARPATIRRAVFRPPTRSITASATRIEGEAAGNEFASMTDNISASPTTSNGNYPRPGGTGAWSNPGNIYSANGTYASAEMDGEQKTKYLRAGGFALSALPDDAIIRGLVGGVRRFASHASTIKEAAVTHAKEDYQGFSNRATSAYVGTSLTTVQFGSSTDLWNEDIPVATQYKASNFGVLVGYDNDIIGADVGAVIYVDHVEVTIYYDDLPDCSGISVTSSWAGNAAGSSWTNPGNAAGSPDTVGATVSVNTGLASEYITLSNFSFGTIPSNNEILGVRVRLDVKVTGACQKWHYLNMFSGSAQMPCRPKFMFVEPTPGTSYAELYYGHCEDTWPYLPGGPDNCFDPSQFGSSFIVILKVENIHGGTTTVDLNAVQVTIWHAEP